MPRCFVVGNGPSLKDTPLGKLEGEISYACNNVHLIYPSTSWRPTHYVRAESAYNLEPEHWLESMQVHLALGCEIHCNDFFFRPRFGLRQTEHVNYLRACNHYAKHYDHPASPHLWHLPVLCTFGSSVNVAVQLAVQEGYDEIYLVGCDLGKDGEYNHFSLAYRHGREQENRYALMDTLAAHLIASRSSPVPIYNATYGGYLDVYPRVNFNDLFPTPSTPLHYRQRREPA